MADSGDPTASRCQVNADKSASVNDADQLLDFYKQWSNKYDEDFRTEHYTGPKLAVDAICEFIPEECRSQQLVVDVAAGTGLIGIELSRNGFNTIDAIDASDDMLTLLKQKGIYRKTTAILLGDGGNDVVENVYDVVTISGGFVPGHVPMAALHDLVRMCKSGGIIAIAMRHEYLSICDEYKAMEGLMTSLEQEHGIWKQLKRTVTPNYLLDKEGIVFVYRKL